MVALSVNSKYNVSVIRTAEDWTVLANQWDALLDSSMAKSMFLTYDWIQSWIRCFLTGNRRLFVVVIREADQLIAAAPWYIEVTRCAGLKSREIRFLGTPETGSDYLDVVARHGCEQDAAEAIYGFLFGDGHGEWDQLSLSDFLSDSLFLFYFMNQLDEAGKFFEIQRHAYIPRAILPDSVESFFAKMSAARYRRSWRRLDRHQGVGLVSLSGQDSSEALARFFRLYEAKSGYDGAYLRKFLEQFCRPESAVTLQIDFLIAENKDVAALVHLVYEKTLHLLLMATDRTFDHRISVGIALIGKSLETAIEKKYTCYDFLKGPEEYKFHWTDTARLSLRLFLGQRTVRSRVCTAYRLLRYFGKAMLR